MKRFAPSALLALSLTACSMAPTYRRPTAPVPPSWPAGDAYLAQNERDLPSLSYQDVFRDPRLQALIAQALENNRDLRIAAATLASVRAQYRIQQAARLPEIDASASADHIGSGQSISVRSVRSTFTTEVGVSAFEADLFGRVKSLTDAAQNSYFATAAGGRAVRLTLIGDIASGWLAYGADRSLLDVASQTVENATKSVALTRSRLSAGLAPRTDLRQAEAILTAAQADLAAQKTAVAQDVNALQLLVGAPINPAHLPTSIEDAAPTVGELPAGLDSGILLRRPDVVEAEYRLRAANAEIGAARAALFPRISLTSIAGLSSSALSWLFTGGAFSFQLGGSASYPVFRAGAGRAGLAGAKAQYDAAYATYEKTIQTAFREVSDALARRGTIDEQLSADSRSADAARDSYMLTDARYKGGLDSFLTSLVAQRTLYSAERTLVTARFEKANNLVILYQVLGGDSLLDATRKGPQPAVSLSPKP